MKFKIKEEIKSLPPKGLMCVAGATLLLITIALDFSFCKYEYRAPSVSAPAYY